MIRTTTDWPFPAWVTRTLVPKGRLGCAAVVPMGSKRSPLAVRVPILYQEAIPRDLTSDPASAVSGRNQHRSAAPTAARTAFSMQPPLTALVVGRHQFPRTPMLNGNAAVWRRGLGLTGANAPALEGPRPIWQGRPTSPRDPHY